jgi:tetratricopeptide (TPR) repeat protein
VGLALAGAGSVARAQAQDLASVSRPGVATDADTDPLAGYLADLEKSRRLPPETASLERLREVLAASEEQLVRGDARAAAVGLFGIVESPRYRPYAGSVPYQSAELLLGRALLRGGAQRSAERYLLRLLGRGPGGAFFVPAHRALVDVALESRRYQALLSALEAIPLQGRPLPDDSAAERAYLRGRVRYQAADLDGAAAAFAQVGRQSRLYASAIYFRGLIAARRGAYKDARGAFCQILPGDKGASLAFNIDGRYFQLQDLARLALGRIAHEQGRYDEAYYYYFSVPEDSDRLGEALFEAAWSMYQKGEVAAARAFVEAFDRAFPDSPLRPEVALLRANIALRSCAFDEARAEATALVQTFGPLQKLAARAAADPARGQALIGRLLVRGQGAAVDPEGRLLALLKLDGRFHGLTGLLAEIDADMVEAREALARWRNLAQFVDSGSLHRAASSPEAAQLLEEAEALLPLAADDPELGSRVSNLLLEVSLVAHPPRSSGPYQTEQANASRLLRELAALREEVRGAAHELASGALREVDERLRGMFGKVRLTHIDAVVGRKKRLEVEIANLRAGRLGADVYGKLKAEGTLGDDEEYWPFEGEYWSDEYERYR